jgi:ABC-2 type transport system permease protein
MVSVMRMSIPPGVPWVELMLSAISALVMTLAVVWAAGRIFRIGILSQGQAPTLRQLLRWIARG